jgi:hypothetical protein
LEDLNQRLSASILLHSINFKDHDDIKIRKEAMTQLEKYQNEENLKYVPLTEFMRNIKRYLTVCTQVWTNTTIMDCITAE